MTAVSTVNVLVPIGALGAGIEEPDVIAGLALGAHVIACDAGSTDSGPAYLASGRSKYSRAATKADLAILIRARARAGIPLLVGSCGTSGCDLATSWMRDIALEICAEEGMTPRIAVLYSEQEASRLAQEAASGRVHPLPPLDAVDPQVFGRCDHIVALMGPEPYVAALEAGADIVLGGRTTDTAVLAAVPLMRGMGAGPAWHAAKIAECGALCSVYPRDGGVMIRVGTDRFEVEPLRARNRCTVETVSAHMLYENSDPFRLIEPGGILDVREASYRQLDARRVEVTGSRWEPQPYTMKLEGAGASAWQTIMLVGIQDPKVLRSLPRFVEQMHEVLTQRVHDAMGHTAGVFDISLRPYGWNAVSGIQEPPHAPPQEVGLLFVATAASQEIATQIAKTCNPMFFHMPLEKEQELPTYAFPFSPAEIERGPVYEFRLNHVVQVSNPFDWIRTEHVQPRGAADAAHR